MQRYVESISFFNNAHRSDSRDVLFDAAPEGVFEVVFQSNELVWQKNQHDQLWQQRDEAFVGGLHQQSFQIKLPPETELMSIRFQPGAFKYVFAGRLNDLANAKVPLVDIWQQEGKKLNDQLKMHTAHQDKIKLVAAFIASKLNVAKRSAIDESVQAIVAGKGVVNIAALEFQSHLSTAQFRKRFREEVGLPPKQYAKIIRVKSVLNDLAAQQPKAMVDLVYAHDYFDQSHFIKEFKSITGKTPSQYFAALSSAS